MSRLNNIFKNWWIKSKWKKFIFGTIFWHVITGQLQISYSAVNFLMQAINFNSNRFVFKQKQFNWRIWYKLNNCQTHEEITVNCVNTNSSVILLYTSTHLIYDTTQYIICLHLYSICKIIHKIFNLNILLDTYLYI